MVDCVPKITDFGLAKELDEDAGQTHTGAVMGTPAYMAPEQAGGRTREVGRTSDVWALGVILYELLTGRPPFRGASVAETLDQVRHREPVSPRALQPTLPRDLETICLKCLQKEPRRRYQSAADLADDLHRFGAGEPIKARPIGRAGRLLRWSRRKRLVASLTAAVIVLVQVAIGVTWGGVLRVSAERDRANVLADEAVAEATRANAETARANVNAASAKTEAARADANAKTAEASAREARNNLAHLQRINASRFMFQGDWSGALLWLIEAMKNDDRPERVEADRIRFASLARHCPTPLHVWQHDGPISPTFSSDGKRVLTVAGRAVHVWEVPSGKSSGPLVHDHALIKAAFSPDARHVLTVGFGGKAIIRLWNISSTPASSVALDHGDAQEALFSPDGRRVLTLTLFPFGFGINAASEVRVWDTASGALRATLRHPGTISATTLSPDGKRLLTVITETQGSGRPTWPGALTGVDLRRVSHLRLWEVETGKLLAGPWKVSGDIAQARFSPDGRRLLTANGGGLGVVAATTLQVWDAATGKQLFEVAGRLSPRLAADGIFGARAAFSGDGRWIIGVGKRLHVWDAATGKPVEDPRPCDTALSWPDMSPDGRRMVALEGGEVRVRDAFTGQPLATRPPRPRLTVGLLQAPQKRSYEIGFGGFGGGFGGALGGARVEFGGGGVLRAGFSPDGRNLLFQSADQTVRLWEASTGQPVGPPLVHAGAVRAALFSPDGRYLLTTSADGTARLWGTDVRSTSYPPLLDERGFRQVTLSPDGRRVLAVAMDNRILLLDAATSRQTCPPLRPPPGVQQAAFSSDGRRLLTVGQETTLVAPLARVWDTASGKAVGPVIPLGQSQAPDIPLDFLRPAGALGPSFVTGPAELTPDGCFVVAAWGIPGQIQGGLGLGGGLGGGGMAGRGGEVRVWDAATGKVAFPALKHPAVPTLATVSPDGRLVLTLCPGQPQVGSGGFGLGGLGGPTQTQEARLWDLRTGKEIWPTWRPGGQIFQAGFSKDGRRLLAAWSARPAEFGGVEVRAWDLAGGKEVFPPFKLPVPVSWMSFGADGRRLLTLSRAIGSGGGGEGGERVWQARVWDLAAGKPLTPLLDNLADAELSDDGKLLLTRSASEARVRDAVTGKPLTAALAHDWPLVAAGLSPDGRWVFTASDDQTVRLWDVATNQALGPPRHFAVQFAFSKDSRRLFSVTDNGAFSVWDLSADEGGAGDRSLLAAVLSGRRLDPAGVAPLEAAEFTRNWSALRTKPWWSRSQAPATAPASWHAQQAEECEAEGEWAAAVWHLDRCVQAERRSSWRLFVRRARAREQLGRWEGAAADYDAVLKEKADDWKLWHARGTALAILGRWDGAVRDFGRAAGFRGASIAARADLALARLAAGDEAGYRAGCRALLQPADPLQHFMGPTADTLRACLLIQDAVPNLFPPATPDSAPTMPAGYVAALFYRCGKFEETLEVCKRGLARLPVQEAGEEEAAGFFPGPGYDRPYFYLLRAMAHHRLKKAEEAGRWLDRARQERAAGPRLPRRAWQQRLEWERLLGEAEGLLSKKPEGKRP